VLVSAKITNPKMPVPIASAKKATVVVTGALRREMGQIPYGRYSLTI
jgi:hypothetical protein